MCAPEIFDRPPDAGRELIVRRIELLRSLLSETPCTRKVCQLIQLVSEPVILAGRTVLCANDAAAAAIGAASLDVLAGRRTDDMVHPDDRGRFAAMMTAAGAPGAGTVRLEQLRFCRDGGGLFTVVIGMLPVRFNDEDVALLVFKELTPHHLLVEDYHLLIDSMEEGFALHEVVLGPDGSPADYRFLDVNPAFERLTGLKADRVIGRTVLDVMPETERSWIARYGRVALTGNPERFEEFSRELNRQFQVTAFSHRKGLFACLFVDTTEQHRSHRDLVERKELLHALLESTGTGIFATGTDGTCIYCNPSCVKLLGFSTAGELLGKDMHALIHHSHPDGSPIARDACKVLDSMAQARGCHSDDEQFWRPDGTSFPVEYWSYPKTRDGNVVGVVVIFVDTTERRKDEQALRMLSQAIEQSPVSIVITDVEGNIEFVNPYFLEMTGYTRDEVTGVNPRVLKSGRTPAETYDQLWSTILAGDVWHGMFCNKRKDGSLFWESATIAPVRNLQGAITHFVGVKEDVTEKRRLEEQVRQSQKLESIGRLAGGVAHDFNNILSAIMGYAALVEVGLPKGDPLHDDVQQIVIASERGAQLTRSLLAFSRKQDLAPKTFKLNRAITDLKKMLQRLIGEDIEFTITLSDGDPYIEADPSQLDQVLINLVTNARDAMPRGGALSIATGTIEATGDDLVAHNLDKPGRYAAIVVTDTGSGMEQDVIDHIFDPFYTTKESGKGTGLGMALVYGIIKKHGGSISIDSTPGRGTAVRVLFPAKDEHPESSRKPADQAMKPLAANLLVAEDDLALRKVLESVLTYSGLSVTMAADGEEALALYRHDPGAYDLVITDVIMPRMNGVELYEALKAVNPAVKVMLMSGYTADTLTKKGFSELDVTLINKPIVPKVLLARIAEALES